MVADRTSYRPPRTVTWRHLTPLPRGCVRLFSRVSPSGGLLSGDPPFAPVLTRGTILFCQPIRGVTEQLRRSPSTLAGRSHQPVDYFNRFMQTVSFFTQL